MELTGEIPHVEMSWQVFHKWCRDVLGGRKLQCPPTGCCEVFLNCLWDMNKIYDLWGNEHARPQFSMYYLNWVLNVLYDHTELVVNHINQKGSRLLSTSKPWKARSKKYRNTTTPTPHRDKCGRGILSNMCCSCTFLGCRCMIWCYNKHHAGWIL